MGRKKPLLEETKTQADLDAVVRSKKVHLLAELVLLGGRRNLTEGTVRRKVLVAEVPLITEEREYRELLEAGGIDPDDPDPPEGAAARFAWERVRLMKKARLDLARGVKMNPSNTKRKRTTAWHAKAEAIFREREREGYSLDEIADAVYMALHGTPDERERRTIRDFLGKLRKRTRA